MLNKLRFLIILCFANEIKPRPLSCGYSEIIDEQAGTKLCCGADYKHEDGDVKKCVILLPRASYKYVPTWPLSTIEYANQILEKSTEQNSSEIALKDGSHCCENKKKLEVLREGYVARKDQMVFVYQEWPGKLQPVLVEKCNPANCPAAMECKQDWSYVPLYTEYMENPDFLAFELIKIEHGCICGKEKCLSSSTLLNKEELSRHLELSSKKFKRTLDEYEALGLNGSSSEPELKPERTFSYFENIMENLQFTYDNVANLFRSIENKENIENTQAVMESIHEAGNLIIIATEKLEKPKLLNVSEYIGEYKKGMHNNTVYIGVNDTKEMSNRNISSEVSGSSYVVHTEDKYFNSTLVVNNEYINKSKIHQMAVNQANSSFESITESVSKNSDYESLIVQSDSSMNEDDKSNNGSYNNSSLKFNYSIAVMNDVLVKDVNMGSNDVHLLNVSNVTSPELSASNLMLDSYNQSSHVNDSNKYDEQPTETGHTLETITEVHYNGSPPGGIIYDNSVNNASNYLYSTEGTPSFTSDSETTDSPSDSQKTTLYTPVNPNVSSSTSYDIIGNATEPYMHDSDFLLKRETTTKSSSEQSSYKMATDDEVFPFKEEDTLNNEEYLSIESISLDKEIGSSWNETTPLSGDSMLFLNQSGVPSVKPELILSEQSDLTSQSPEVTSTESSSTSSELGFTSTELYSSSTTSGFKSTEFGTNSSESKSTPTERNFSWKETTSTSTEGNPFSPEQYSISSKSSWTSTESGFSSNKTDSVDIESDNILAKSSSTSEKPETTSLLTVSPLVEVNSEEPGSITDESSTSTESGANSLESETGSTSAEPLYTSVETSSISSDLPKTGSTLAEIGSMPVEPGATSTDPVSTLAELGSTSGDLDDTTAEIIYTSTETGSLSTQQGSLVESGLSTEEVESTSGKQEFTTIQQKSTSITLETVTVISSSASNELSSKSEKQDISTLKPATSSAGLETTLTESGLPSTKLVSISDESDSTSLEYSSSHAEMSSTPINIGSTSIEPDYTPAQLNWTSKESVTVTIEQDFSSVDHISSTMKLGPTSANLESTTTDRVPISTEPSSSAVKSGSSSIDFSTYESVLASVKSNVISLESYTTSTKPGIILTETDTSSEKTGYISAEPNTTIEELGFTSLTSDFQLATATSLEEQDSTTSNVELSSPNTTLLLEIENITEVNNKGYEPILNNTVHYCNTINCNMSHCSSQFVQQCCQFYNVSNASYINNQSEKCHLQKEDESSFLLYNNCQYCDNKSLDNASNQNNVMEIILHVLRKNNNFEEQSFILNITESLLKLEFAKLTLLKTIEEHKATSECSWKNLKINAFDILMLRKLAEKFLKDYKIITHENTNKSDYIASESVITVFQNYPSVSPFSLAMIEEMFSHGLLDCQSLTNGLFVRVFNAIEKISHVMKPQIQAFIQSLHDISFSPNLPKLADELSSIKHNVSSQRVHLERELYAKKEFTNESSQILSLFQETYYNHYCPSKEWANMDNNTYNSNLNQSAYLTSTWPTDTTVFEYSPLPESSTIIYHENTTEMYNNYHELSTNIDSNDSSITYTDASTGAYFMSTPQNYKNIDTVSATTQSDKISEGWLNRSYTNAIVNDTYAEASSVTLEYSKLVTRFPDDLVNSMSTETTPLSADKFTNHTSDETTGFDEVALNASTLSTSDMDTDSYIVTEEYSKYSTHMPDDSENNISTENSTTLSQFTVDNDIPTQTTESNRISFNNVTQSTSDLNYNTSHMTEEYSTLQTPILDDSENIATTEKSLTFTNAPINVDTTESLDIIDGSALLTTTKSTTSIDDEPSSTTEDYLKLHTSIHNDSKNVKTEKTMKFSSTTDISESTSNTSDSLGVTTSPTPPPSGIDSVGTSTRHDSTEDQTMSTSSSVDISQSTDNIGSTYTSDNQTHEISIITSDPHHVTVGQTNEDKSTDEVTTETHKLYTPDSTSEKMDQESSTSSQVPLGYLSTTSLNPSAGIFEKPPKEYEPIKIAPADLLKLIS